MATAFFQKAATFSPNLSQESGFQAPPLTRNMTELSIQSVRPNDSIVNQRGGVNASMYQTCLGIRKRLATVPGFDKWLSEMDQEEQYSEEETDPVTLLWNTLRRGEPLLTIYNALRPDAPLVLKANVSLTNAPKAATFQFLQKCLEEFKFPVNECFLITDLYGSDTTGFVKVLKVINRVLDILKERGLLLEEEEDKQGPGGDQKGASYRDKVIGELVQTERDYVQHLETLQMFKNELEDNVPGDVLHDIFLNLNALLDFQRRFLIRIEQQNSLDASSQNWGQIFCQYHEHFLVYEPFIANSNRCNRVVMQNWDKISQSRVSPAFQDMINAQTVLTGFLLKPFQRLSKYPLLLDDLLKRGDYDVEHNDHLRAGSEAMRSVLDLANKAVERAKMDEEVLELMHLVDDWKGHRIDSFGSLVLCGTYPVVKGEGSKETEREPPLKKQKHKEWFSYVYFTNGEKYKIFLFQRILLCCKELNPKKEKNRLAGKSSVDKRGKPKLQLKGRIFIQNVTDMISTPKNEHHLLQIWWKGDPGIETFIIKFKIASEREKWSEQIKTLREDLRAHRSHVSAGVSQTEFTSLAGLTAQVPNPYREQEDYDDDDEAVRYSGTTLNSQSSYDTVNRHVSNLSLRSRSTTAGSGSIGRAPPRFPLPQPLDPTGLPLKVTTNIEEPSTPDERFSHFSPTGDSPNSMRSSSQAGMYPFPRQHTPSNGAWSQQDANGNKHNTAPPMGRLQQDESGYGQNGRSVQRPSLPAMSQSQSAQQLMAQRSRSISSPDIHNQQPRRLPNGQMSNGAEEVPVPSIPSHLVPMRGPVNRSQNNSPTDGMRHQRNQSPSVLRNANSYQDQYGQYAPQRTNGGSIGAGSRQMQSTSGNASQGDAPMTVSQLKIKVHYDPPGSHVTIVAPVIIKHRSLIDRIDSKMDKVKNDPGVSLSNGSARLRYKDQDDELVLIENDEDIAMAIEDWLEMVEPQLRSNVMPDFDLYWAKNERKPTA